jgi:hypothetical protein
MTEQHAPEVEDLTGLVSQIVQLREQIKVVEAQKLQAQEQVNTCTTQLLGLKNEMKDARKLLDHCLTTGEDVTSVKLTKTVSELQLTKRILMEDEDQMFDKVNKQYLDLLTRTASKRF